MNFLKKKTTITIEVEHSYDNTEDLLNAVKNNIKNNSDKIDDTDTFGHVSVLGKINAITEEKNILDLNQSDKREFLVTRSFTCRDTCWNQPKRKQLCKDTKIKITGSANNGDIFAEDQNGERYVINNNEAVKSRCPYDNGLLNMDYFEAI